MPRATTRVLLITLFAAAVSVLGTAEPNQPVGGVHIDSWPRVGSMGDYGSDLCVL